MKRKACMVLCFLLILILPVSVLAYSNSDDTIHYAKGTISNEDVNTLRYTIVDIPDQNTAAAASDEDTVYYGINQLNPEDFLPLTPTPINDIGNADGSSSRAAYVRLEFPGAISKSVYSDFIEHIITAGSSATLSINICVWAPEAYNLEIGIYNWKTGENWYVVRSGGSVSNYTKTFTNLTAGHYSVYIRNLGTNSLTTGYMLYNLT